ncbi:MAG: chemotaxis protein CheX, partial [Deltaproteobacteria bacterium]|nr:chemotaxis protein CheX [Deltaproteobacteria bacterium]
MSEQLKEILSRVAGETLEKLAFMFSFPEDERGRMILDSAVAAFISFSGPFSGTLVMTVSNQLLPELAANMLGVDDEETTLEQQHDALKETINIICGNLLPVIAGEEVVFNIDAPMIIAGVEAIKEAIEDHGHKPASIVKLNIEESECDLFLFINGRGTMHRAPTV